MTVDSAVLIGWSRAIPGHELQGVQMLRRAMDYFGKLQEAGAISGFEAFELAPSGGDLNGFVLIRGNRQSLFEVRQSDNWLDLVTEASLHVDGLRVIEANTGEAVTRGMERIAAAVKRR